MEDGINFPRLTSRGPIEAVCVPLALWKITDFPRLTSRGPIEATQQGFLKRPRVLSATNKSRPH